MKPGTEAWIKRIYEWAKRIQKTKNGDKIFCGSITRGKRQTSWRRADLDKEIEQGPNTGPYLEQVARYEDLNVEGYDNLVERRSLPIMARQDRYGWRTK